MKPVGLNEVETAYADGRWKNAYDPSSTMAMPTDFLKRLSKMRKAKDSF
jgi:uncharacterized protein YdeI (YjbR/CyaY-like superfamily)